MKTVVTRGPRSPLICPSHPRRPNARRLSSFGCLSSIPISSFAQSELFNNQSKASKLDVKAQNRVGRLANTRLGQERSPWTDTSLSSLLEIARAGRGGGGAPPGELNWEFALQDLPVQDVQYEPTRDEYLDALHLICPQNLTSRHCRTFGRCHELGYVFRCPDMGTCTLPFQHPSKMILSIIARSLEILGDPSRECFR